MPRDLTDLMEQATSFAPPEPHAAADVTALAAARLRRRRGGVAGVVAVAVLVAGGLGYGVTRGHDSTPEPAARFKHGLTVRTSDAVPAASLPGYRAEQWAIPSLQRYSSSFDPLPTYRSVDADGRLLVQRHSGSPQGGTIQVQLYDHPGALPSPLQRPPSPGSNNGHPVEFVPSFTGDGRLLWSPDLVIADGSKDSFHLTDLQGGHDVRVPSDFTIGKTGFSGTPPSGASTLGIGSGSPGWGLSGDRYWFAAYDHNLPGVKGAAFTIYSAGFDGRLTKVADDVAVMSAGDGRVAWVTTQGEVMTETAADPTPRRVPVPLSEGCRVPVPRDIQGGLGPFTADGSVIAMTESCGSGKNADLQLLAFDPSGRMLVHLVGGPAFELSLTPDAILAETSGRTSSDFDVVRYDLVTGRLADLGVVAKSSPSPQGAGDYVLWYDTKGGHVARIPD